MSCITQSTTIYAPICRVHTLFMDAKSVQLFFQGLRMFKPSAGFPAKTNSRAEVIYTAAGHNLPAVIHVSYIKPYQLVELEWEGKLTGLLSLGLIENGMATEAVLTMYYELIGYESEPLLEKLRVVRAHEKNIGLTLHAFKALAESASNSIQTHEST